MLPAARGDTTFRQPQYLRLCPGNVDRQNSTIFLPHRCACWHAADLDRRSGKQMPWMHLPGLKNAAFLALTALVITYGVRALPHLSQLPHSSVCPVSAYRDVCRAVNMNIPGQAASVH